jgi:hypothetical protein
MNQSQRSDQEPPGASTLDLVLLIAGFACGWVMHEKALFTVGSWHYFLPAVLSSATFRSLLGTAWIRWLWAYVVGLAFLIVGRRFRYDCRKRPAEWLAVALAIVLFESVYQVPDGRIRIGGRNSLDSVERRSRFRVRSRVLFSSGLSAD